MGIERLHKLKVVFRTPWLRVLEKKIINGGKKSSFYIVDSSPRLVSILAIDNKNNLLLVSQFRHAVNKKTVDLPGGAVEKNETPLNAAKRELLEETGIIAEKWELMFTTYQDSGRSTAKKWVFLAENLTQCKSKQDEMEGITSIFLPMGHVYKQIFDKKQNESTLITSVLWYLAKQGNRDAK